MHYWTAWGLPLSIGLSLALAKVYQLVTPSIGSLSRSVVEDDNSLKTQKTKLDTLKMAFSAVGPALTQRGRGAQEEKQTSLTGAKRRYSQAGLTPANYHGSSPSWDQGRPHSPIEP